MEVFDSLERHIQNPLVLQSILSLMERGTLVLTTNYDNLLELFGQQQNRPMQSLDLKDKTKVGPGPAPRLPEPVCRAAGLPACPAGGSRSSHVCRCCSGRAGTCATGCCTSTASTPTPVAWSWTPRATKT